MEENPEIIEQFASVLEEKLAKKTSFPYNASIYQDQCLTELENTFTAKDVICGVSKQMQAIQNADCVASNKRASHMMNKYKKSTFVTVNTLSRVEMPNQKSSTSKQDMNTQFTMDTQLFDVIKDAEALQGTSGVTQEFDSSFFREEVEDGPSRRIQKECPILDITLKAPDPKNKSHSHPMEPPSLLQDNKTEHNDKTNVYDQYIASPVKDSVLETEVDIPINQSPVFNVDNLPDKDNDIVFENEAKVKSNMLNSATLTFQYSTVVDVNAQPNRKNNVFDGENTSQNNDSEVKISENKTQNDDNRKNTSQNKVKSLNDIQMIDEDLKMDVDIININSPILDTDMEPSSQILSTKTKSKRHTQSSLVVDLECFENFESIAATLCAEHIDSNIEVVKEILSAKLSQHSAIHKDAGSQNEIENDDIVPDDQKVIETAYVLHDEQNAIDASHILKTVSNNGVESNTESLDDKVKNIDVIQNSIETIKGNDVDQYKKDNSLQTSNQTIIDTVATDDSKSNINILTNTIECITGNLSSVLTKSEKETNDLVKNEILFSSDEEKECVYEITQDLPLTCALETSFYDDQSEVLNKTMYVAFHTASNKSIQVLTDSFSKAKSFLDDDNRNEGQEKTVSELVDICSSSKQSLKSVKSMNNERSKVCIVTQQGRKSFKDNLEEVRDKITNTITSGLEYVIGKDDLVFSEKPPTECLKIDVGMSPVDQTLPTSPQSMIIEDQNWSNLLMIKKNDTFDDKVDFVKEKPNDKENINNIEDVGDVVVQSQELFDESNDDYRSIEVEVNNEPYKCSQIISFVKSKANTNVCEIKSDCSSDEYLHLPVIEDYEIKSDASTDEYKHLPFIETKEIDLIKKSSNKSDASTDEYRHLTIIETKEIDHIKENYYESDGPTDEYLHLPVIDTKKIDLIKISGNTSLKMDDTYLIEQMVCPSSQIIPFDDNVPSNPKFEEQGQAKELTTRITEEDTESHIEKIIIIRDTEPEAGKVVSYEDIELPKSQIISHITRVQKRKRDPSQASTNKRRRVEFSIEAKTAGLDDIEFETCDFKEITLKDSGKVQANKDQETDEVDNKAEEVKTEFKDLGSHSKDVNLGDKTTSICREENYEVKIAGFKTTGNKSIEVSEGSISRSKEVFQDLSEDPSLAEKSNDAKENALSSSSNILEAFRTASIKAIISPEYFEVATRFFIDVDELRLPKKEIKTETIMNSGTDTDNSEETPFHGFCITQEDRSNVMKEIESCKKVLEEQNFDGNIFDVEHLKNPIIYTPDAGVNKTETSLEENDSKGKPNFEIIETSSNIQAQNQEKVSITTVIASEIKKDKRISNSPSLQGDEASSERFVQLSEEALIKMEYFFKDIDKMCEENLIFDPDTNEGHIPPFEGFKTTSKKPVKISTNSLERTKKIFQNLDQDFDTELEFKVPQLQGFQTASKKPVNVSAKALKRSKKVFQNIYKSDVFNPKASTSSSKDLKPQFEGSETANKKTIPMSSKALARSKKIFENIDFTEEELTPPTFQNTEDMFGMYQSFQTATNNYVKVSKDALDMSRKVFQDIDDRDIDISKNKTVTSSPIDTRFHGFQTASNKQVQISHGALAKSRKIFQDIDDIESDISINETITSSHPMDNRFQGFQTASNKQVKISKEALAKSRKVFQDINKEDTAIARNISDMHQPIESNFQGFQTASNKAVKISAEALAKSKKKFQGISDTPTDTLISTEIRQPIDTKFQGFQTASNKEVKISEEALAKSRKIFQDIDAMSNTEITADDKGVKMSKKSLAKSKTILQDIYDIGTDISSDISRPKDSKFQGFQTASNKEVKISYGALAKSRKILQNINDIPTNTDISTVIFQPINTKFQGFETASNKAVKISAEALAKSKKIFQETDISSNIGQPKDTKFQGFQTASNKEVKISEQALAKSKKIFQDITDIDADISTDFIQSKDSKFQVFQTASNKVVKISVEALAKSKNIFQGIHTISDTDISTDNGQPKDTKFQGFQTASKKKVNISEEALAKSKELFRDINTEKVTNDVVNTKFQGFQTASKKEVKISEEALAKSKQLFQHIEIDDHTISSKDTSNKFQGFKDSTASKKKVLVSEQALEISKKLCQDIDSQNRPSEIKPKHFDFGFTTASNNKIVVSEEALAKSKQLFAEIDNHEAKSDENETHKKIHDHIEHDDIINTQVLNNFEQTLHAEDFFKDTTKTVPKLTPKVSKRSGSPILSCPKVKKRRKFEIPYSQKVVKQKDCAENIIHDSKEEVKKNKEVNNLTFEENYKKSEVYNLKDLVKLEIEDKSEKPEPDPYILNFNFDNLLDLEFMGPRNDLDESITDKKSLKEKLVRLQNVKEDSNNTRVTTKDLIEIFEASVNKSLIPKGWIENHIKLILWKLLSYEIRFPKIMNNICTAQNVIEQLKYRYDRELFNSERPALRKILEKDDVPSRTLVLCVAAILVDGVQVIRPTTSANLELLLTDGWYLIKGSLDQMLARLVCEGKITVGTKIVTNGAELVGCEQGIAPWEDTSQIRLKLSGNSTRKAHWDARLGYHGNAAILSRLTAVKPDGGKVAKLRAFVTRVYPALYVEKFDDGSTVTRSERLELIHQSVHETDRQIIMEKLYEEVEKELADQDSPESQPLSRREYLDSGSQILRAMTHSKDPQEYRYNLTSTQQNLLENHECKKQERYLQEFQDRVQEKMSKMGLNIVRNVVSLLKARIVDVHEIKGTVHVSRAMLSIWKPSEAVRDIVKEGTWIEVLNVVPTAVRYSETQISAGRQSIFSQSKYQEPEKLKPYIKSLQRTCYPIKDLFKNPNMNTDYNEVDTAGFIFEIDPEKKNFDPNKNQFQNVYLTDENKHIICVNFWGGLKKLGFENIFDTGQIVACTNLQKRSGNTRKNIPQFRATEFSYFTKTPRSVVAREIVEDLCKKTVGMDRGKFCSDCISFRNNFSVLKLQNTDNVSPYRFPNIDINSSKNKAFIESPFAQKQSKTDENLNLTGLDFESTFNQEESQELSAKTLQRKRQMKEKLSKLKMYGEPPPLSPMIILNQSKNAGIAYKSPLPKLDLSVASEKKNIPIQTNSDCNQTSPVLKSSKTYGKRNVHPVKLDFTKNICIESSVDHFAEDFDDSPPLSLD